MLSVGVQDVDIMSGSTSAASSVAAAAASTPIPPPFVSDTGNALLPSMSKDLHIPAIPVVQPTLLSQRPQPCRVETEHQILDRWASALADWVIPRWDHSIRELDGWRTVSGMHGGFVRDCSLSVFVLLGAAEEMPFTVYRAFDTRRQSNLLCRGCAICELDGCFNQQ